VTWLYLTHKETYQCSKEWNDSDVSLNALSHKAESKKLHRLPFCNVTIIIIFIIIIIINIILAASGGISAGRYTAIRQNTK
jgi:hypothetical protein